MRLQYTALVGIEEMESAFPKTVQPGLGLTDYLINLTPNAVADVLAWKVETLLNCGFQQPIFVPHNQVNTAGTTIVDDTLYVRAALPSLNWSTLTVAGPNAIQAFASRPGSFQYFDILATDESMSDSMGLTAAATLSHSGFTAILHKNHWNNVKTSPTNPAYWDLQWQVDGDFYRVASLASENARLDYSSDGVHWKTINARLKVAGNPMKTLWNSNPGDGGDGIHIEVIAMNGLMMVSVGGQTTPFVTALPGGSAYPTISNVTIHAANFTQFSWHVHPLMFAANAGYTSQQKPLGVVPFTLPRYTVVTLNGPRNLTGGSSLTENSCTVAVQTINPATPNPQYTLTVEAPVTGTYNGTDYSKYAAGVARVTLLLDGLFQTRPYNPRRIVPQEIRENISFDVNQLSIRHTADITLSNFIGISEWNRRVGLRGFGNQHVTMRLGWAHQPGGPDGGLGWQHFYGFANRYCFRRGVGGRSHLTLSCVDQMQQLQDVLVAAPPDLDGTNHFSAMAYCAVRAGISPYQLGFAALVPTIGGGTLFSNPADPIDFYSYAPLDPSPTGFFLPQGSGLHPWTPRDRTLPLLQLMQQIRTVTGYLLFFDAYGYLRYEPWIPPIQNLPKKTFRETASDGYGYEGGAFNEMFDLTVTSSTEETRNQVIVVGVDSYGPDWSPIVIKYEDSASISLPFGQQPLGNYIGYPKPFIWLDSRFADPNFANEAAANMFEFMRLPEYTVQFTSWMQPDIFPMDTIYVQDWRSNSSNIPFYVMSVNNCASVLGDNLELTSSITGKFLV